MAQRKAVATQNASKLTKLELRGRLGAPKWPRTAPGRPAPAHSTPKMRPNEGRQGSKRHPWTHQRPPRGPLRTPRGAQETPKGAQEGSKMAQEGSKTAQVESKVGPEMRKVSKVKLLKNHLFLKCFGPPGRPKMTPRGSQMVHLDPRGRQDDPDDLSNGPGDLSVTCQTGQRDLSRGLRWSRFTHLQPKSSRIGESLLSNCPEIRSP